MLKFCFYQLNKLGSPVGYKQKSLVVQYRHYFLNSNSKRTHMDIQFVEEQHRENIFKIMELCGCDLAEAYELYQNNSCNVEAAVQAKFNPPHQNYSSPSKYQSPQHFSSFYQSKFQDKLMGVTDQYENYRIFKESGVNFNQRYNVRKEGGYLNQIKGVFTKFVGSNDSSLKRQLEQFMGRRSNLKVNTGSLSESLQSVWRSKFPLVVHLLNFNPASKDQVKAMYGNEEFMDMLNTQFQNYLLDTRNYQLEEYLAEFIDLKNDSNSLIVLRVNHIDEITLVSKISWSQLSMAQIKKKLKQVKSSCINIEMEELHLDKRYQQELKGNFDYVKPMSLAEQRKLKQDRQIRRKQEQQFFKAMQPKKETQTQGGVQQKTEVNARENQKHNTKESQSAQQINSKRQKIRQGLKKYSGQEPGCIAIKLRFPSSKTTTLQVSNKQSVSYLYDFVESRQEQLGFEDELKRAFDIIEPYQKINLSEKKGQTLGSVFEGQNMLSLVVSQKSQ